jgi:hypothetical protein
LDFQRHWILRAGPTEKKKTSYQLQHTHARNHCWGDEKKIITTAYQHFFPATDVDVQIHMRKLMSQQIIDINGDIIVVDSHITYR